MADKRISELTATPSALVGTENIPIVQSGGTYKETPRNITKIGYQDVITDSSGARTLSVTDRGAWLRFTNATATTLTVPLNSSVAFAIGECFNGIQAAAGKVTVTGAGGVTINLPTDYKSNTRAQGAPLCLIKVATDTWDLMGDLEAI